VERGSMRWTAATARRRPGEALCRRRQCRSRGAEGGAEEEERRERSRDSSANFKSYRDPTEKYFFPLIQGFSEKKSNMKIVEFFKLYTFSLKLKFENSKFATL
jgi:hypothetical protein